MLTNGTITQVQFDALLAAIGGGSTWLDILSKIGGVAATVVLGGFGVAKGTPAMVAALKKNGNSTAA